MVEKKRISKRREMVIRVIDGDTFMTASRIKPVRLANYNAPERGEAGYKSRADFLRKRILGKKVSVQTKARDVYGRAVANVKIGNRSLNDDLRMKYKKK